MSKMRVWASILACLALTITILAVPNIPYGVQAKLPEGQLDEVSISGWADNWLAYTFTNKRTSYLWMSTTGEPLSEFSGFNAKKLRVLESWRTVVNGTTVTPGAGEFTYLPFKFSRTTEAYTEEVFMPDNEVGVVIRYTSISSPLSISFTPHLETAYEDACTFDSNVLIFQSHDPGREDVAYVAITSDHPLVYDGSNRGRVTHEYRFDEMRINNRESRYGIVLCGGDLIADEVDGDIKFAIGVGSSRGEAILIASRLISQYDDLLEAKTQRIMSLINSCDIDTGDENLTKALKLAIASADSLLVKEPYGKVIWAGLPWFNQGWGRDTFISLSGLTLVTGRFEEAEQILRDFAQFQRVSDGRIPNRIGDWLDYSTADATPWFLKRCWDYYLWTGKTKFLEDIFSCIERAIEGTWETYVDPGDGFVSHEGKATWMDTSRDPREGKAVEVQALWIDALLDASNVAEMLGYVSKAENWRRMADDIIEKFRSIFWNDDFSFLYDYIDVQGRMVDRVRPNAFIAVVAVDGADLISPEKREDMVRTALDRDLIAPHGVRSLIPSDPLYVGIDDETWDPPAYHNGDVWPWLSGPVIQVFSEAGFVGEASRIFKLYINQILNQANVGSIHEIMDGDRDQPKGCWTQAWSIAEFLRAYFEVFLGIKPTAGDLVISPQPIEGVDYISASFRIGEIAVDEIYRSDSDGQSLTLATDSTIHVLARFRVPSDFENVLVSVDGEGFAVEVDENGNVEVPLLVDGETKIDIRYGGLGGITLDVPPAVSTPLIEVSGATFPFEQVKIYVNGKLSATATADSAGNYSAHVRLDEGSNVIRAEISGAWAEATVNYLAKEGVRMPWLLIIGVAVSVVAIGVMVFVLKRR